MLTVLIQPNNIVYWLDKWRNNTIVDIIVGNMFSLMEKAKVKVMAKASNGDCKCIGKYVIISDKGKSNKDGNCKAL